MTMNRKIMAIAAHPDDEVLGCGGTLRRHVDQGDEVCIYILADGDTSRYILETENPAAVLQAKGEAARAAGDILGASRVILDEFPDNRMDSRDLLEIIRKVEQQIRHFRPDVVYTHHSGDLNIDHRSVHEAVVTACRPQPGNTVKTLLFFEIASSTEWQVPSAGKAFAPDWFVDITATLDAKMQALAKYHVELRPWPHPRSIEAVEHLSRWRGATVGVQVAEAFMLGRHLI